MAISIVMPKLGMVMSEGTVAKYTKSPGENVTQGEIIAEIETEKINYDLEATGSGVFHPVVTAGTVVPVDGLLGYLLAEGEAVPEPEVQQPIEPPSKATATKRMGPTSRPSGTLVRSTPGARRLAAKMGVDLSAVSPTGPGGRVIEDDVRSHNEQKLKSGPEELPIGLPEPAKAIVLEGIRGSIAQHMRDSITNTAQLSFFIDVDVTEAQLQRRQVSNDKKTSITMGDVLIKACAEALKRHPEHNTVLSNSKILYFDEINIGFAVALTDGLIVPVVKRVGEKNILEIAKATRDLAAKAKEGKLMPDAVAGGTFTISVLGSVDGFTPILNAGQNAILGVGRSLQKPVVQAGEVVIREMMTISLTVDHQVIDGAIAASFLRRFQQIVGRPTSLFK